MLLLLCYCYYITVTVRQFVLLNYFQERFSALLILKQLLLFIHNAYEKMQTILANSLRYSLQIKKGRKKEHIFKTVLNYNKPNQEAILFTVLQNN